MIQAMLDFIRINKEWFFSGAGVVAISAIFNFLRNKTKEKDPPTTNQIATRNAVNIQGSGDIAVGSIIVKENSIPTKLAKPIFFIKPSGRTLISGQDPEHRLQIHNRGGDCYNVNLQSDVFSKEFNFPKISRGRHTSITVTTPRGTDAMTIIITALDGNGMEHQQAINGINFRDGYKFY
ncbi:hypothetical protein FXN63_06505 [Pigmentiphaga aceris]|uniref:Uncharacterized protein n=1 Tax=Pigmentiphaga aceris TaxID=1940612 RepID=A0A5C0AT70_9BURK|nr:hypothetical protein [Pigmentiphaga aceris]QEI05529.1 hypothetical protein FXN63_06505 [Pigmentiphaga aceris]